jgi:tetratricopeptide (TPR) repeat protein
VLFLDTETSGLAGGTGTYAFMIGVGYRTEEGFELLQFFMRDPSQESAILAALDELASHFDVVVTFNGKSFDIPLLNTRYTLNGLTPPFAPFQHIDLLHLARKLWRDRLPSRALGELENAILNVGRTREDVPGWMIPEMYFEYLRSGDARPLANVFYHNAIDILSLAALYNHVAGLLNDPLQTAADSGFDLAAIARLYEEMGRIEEAAQLYASSLDRGDLPEEFFFKTIERYALLRRRQGEWDKAVQLWRQAAEHGELFACIELSKFYEHRERNYTEALRWANFAYQTLKERYFWEQAGRPVEKEIERRIGRLTQRVYRAYE